MVSVFLFAVLQSARGWSAHWAEVDHSRALVVERDGRRYVIQQTGSGSSAGQPEQFMDVGPEGIKFKGHRFVASGSTILDAATGARVELPHTDPPALQLPGFRLKGAAAAGDHMLWIFAWDDGDVSLEPSSEVLAYEVGLENNHPVVVRTTELPALTGINTYMCGVRHENDFLLVSSSDRFVDLDMKEWKPVASAEDVVFGL